MGRWKNDAELFELMRERLYTPVAGDILDAMGYSRQFLPAYIMPLRDEMKLAGRACTVLEQNVFEPQKKPFGLLTEALDQLKRDEVYLATGAANSALWGELLTATAKARGAAGAVLDGYTRDTPQVLQQNFPVFAKGRWAQDSFIRTNVVDFRCRIEIGQVVIDDGGYCVRGHGRRADHSAQGRGRVHRAGAGKGRGREGGEKGHRGRHERHGGIPEVWNFIRSETEKHPSISGESDRKWAGACLSLSVAVSQQL